MTEESFDKAVELRSEIKNLYDLLDTIKNCVGPDKSLIAKYNTTGDTINSSCINRDICQKLALVIQEEISAKAKEFENL